MRYSLHGSHLQKYFIPMKFVLSANLNTIELSIIYLFILIFKTDARQYAYLPSNRNFF